LYFVTRLKPNWYLLLMIITFELVGQQGVKALDVPLS
jgi:hypothetical protein